MGELPRHKGEIGNGSVVATTPEVTSPSSHSTPLPAPCSMLQSIQDSTLPILYPVTSSSLLLTFAGLGSGADALPGARPSFLFSPQDISLLGISVTPSRGKVMIRFSLNSWLAHSPAPAATQEMAGCPVCQGQTKTPTPLLSSTPFTCDSPRLGSREGALEEARLRFQSWLGILPAV